jgi:hypothetical protein
MDITGLSSVADLAKTVVNKIWPDKTEEEKQQLAAALTIVQGQLNINNTEAANPSVFVSGWRPAIGWVCAVALAYQYLIRPISIWILLTMNHPVPQLPGLDDNLWQLMLGMLGLGSLRTYEKVNGISTK